MSTAIICVLIGGLLPVLLGLVAKFGGMRAGVAYDNAQPRIIMATYTGWYQRADWAQKNAHEAFPMFAAAVAICMATGVNASLLASWSIIWLLARFGHAIFYIANLASLRSLIWLVACAANIRLLVAAI